VFSIGCFRRLVWVALAVGLGACALITAGVAPASVAGSEGWKVQTSPNPGGSSTTDGLAAVAASSPGDAWAVGSYYDGTAYRTLIEHWNGHSWHVQKSPNVGGSGANNNLYGVAATSPTDAWAVGDYDNGQADQTLVEHWNGKVWKVLKSPDVGGSGNLNELFGVAATSPTDAWAVGDENGYGPYVLVEHWNGKVWRVQKSPKPGGSKNGSQLTGVAATSATNAWAVGYYGTFPLSGPSHQRMIIEHWNGKVWQVQTSPRPQGSNHAQLSGVAATSPQDALAVGYYQHGTAVQTLVEHWNGKAWQQRKSPNAGGFSNLSELYGVAMTSDGEAWAVGNYENRTAEQTLIEHWNGNAWRVQKSPNPGGSKAINYLSGLAATSPTKIWAVGGYHHGSASRTLVEHCC
jgi:hypothetical protein